MNYFAIPSLHNQNTLKQLYLLDITSELVGRNLNKKENIVIQTICNFYNISFSDLKGRNQKRNIAEARHVVLFALTQFCNLSHKYAASMLDRDHSTSVHSVNTVYSFLQFDKQFQKTFEKLKELINK